MKTIDLIVAVLLVIGGLNWGLVGIFGFDLVSGILGDMTGLSRLVYTVVGLCAVYQIFQLRSIQRRWNVATERVS